jgi:uncharacterized protein DUF4905
MRPDKNTLQPVLAEKMNGLIWKLKVNTNGLLAIESRNPTAKEVSFSVFDFRTGKPHFRERTYTEPWNLSLAFIGKENVVLTGYDHPGSPESKGIISLDNLSGEILWEKFNLALHEVRNNGLKVFDPRFQPRRFQWIDHLTGTAIENPSEYFPEDEHILFPENVDESSLPEYVTHGQIVGEILQLSFGNEIFASFHEAIGDYLQQRLIGYQDDRILLDIILNSGIQKLQPEAFFIQQNHLFCIRDKQEIISYFV